jgi:hypothetical protein
MKRTITSLGGRAPPGRKTPRFLQNFIGAFQFDHFTLESFELLALGRRQARML